MPTVPPSPPTCSLGPSDPLVMQPGTHTQPLTQWLKATCYNTTTNAKQHYPCYLGHKSRVQQLHTLSNNCHNRPMSPAGNATSHPHTAITPMAEDCLPQPTPPCHVMQHGGPTHAQHTPTPPMAQGIALNTCLADPPKLTPTHMPCQWLPANNPQCQLLNCLLGHLTIPNWHPPPMCTGPMLALFVYLTFNYLYFYCLTLII
jgi:hypothetical protein